MAVLAPESTGRPEQSAIISTSAAVMNIGRGSDARAVTGNEVYPAPGAIHAHGATATLIARRTVRDADCECRGHQYHPNAETYADHVREPSLYEVRAGACFAAAVQRSSNFELS